MKFKKRAADATLDIVVTDVEARFTPGGKAVARIYAQELDSIIFQLWTDDPDHDEKYLKLLDVSRGTVITITGRAKEETIQMETLERETMVRRTFNVDTWTDNRSETPLPENITEVPY